MDSTFRNLQLAFLFVILFHFYLFIYFLDFGFVLSLIAALLFSFYAASCMCLG